jgi:prepilin-type N-terminal cleavage/methylation domain-containing protein
MNLQRDNRGFSLTEALVSLAIASMLLLMAYTAHRSIMLSIKDMSQIAEFYQNVNLVMNRINTDVSAALFISGNNKTFFVGSNDMGSRNNGKLTLVTINRLIIIFRILYAQKPTAATSRRWAIF